MARIVRLVCDAHLAEGEEVTAIERNLTIDGNKKKPHLCDPCYDEHVAPVLAWLNELDGSQNASKNGAAKRSRSRKAKPADVRAWAKSKGLDVPTAGRLPQELFDQYEAEKAS